jgi:hypothetical protein
MVGEVILGLKFFVFFDFDFDGLLQVGIFENKEFSVELVKRFRELLGELR